MTRAFYYEDFEAGQQFRSLPSAPIDKEAAIAFAREYDPQLQHVDEHGAKNSLFGELIVSGWQTAALTMKLKTGLDIFQNPMGIIGMGLDNVRWPRPTRPGDTLYIVLTVLSKRTSNSRPDRGIIQYKVETFNQRDELAMEMTTSVLIPRRA